MASLFYTGPFVEAVTIYRLLGQSAARKIARHSHHDLTRCLINVQGYFIFHVYRSHLSRITNQIS